MRTHRRNARLGGARRLSVAQHGAIREECNLHALALDDGGLARFFGVPARADDMFTHAAKHFDGIQHRLGAPIHRVIAGHRDHVHVGSLPHFRHARIKPRQLSARPVGILRLPSALGIGAFALAKTQIRLTQHRRDQLSKFFGRPAHRADVAPGH